MEIVEGDVTSQEVAATESGNQNPNENPAAPPATGTEPSTPPEPETTAPPQAAGTAPAAAGTPAPGETPTGTEDGEPTPTETQEDKVARMEKMLNSQSAVIRRMERAGKRKAAPKLPDPIDDKDAPNIDDFDTIDEHEAAMIQWRIDKGVNEGVRKALESNPVEEIEADREVFKEEVRDQGLKKYKDFKEVVLRDTLPLSADVLDTIRVSDSENVSPADVLYYLGKNEAEAVRISRLNPIQMAREIVKIENTIEKAGGATRTTPAKPSNAPPPTTPTPTSVLVTKDPDKMSQAEYEKWRREGGGT